MLKNDIYQIFTFLKQPTTAILIVALVSIPLTVKSEESDIAESIIEISTTTSDVIFDALSTADVLDDMENATTSTSTILITEPESELGLEFDTDIATTTNETVVTDDVVLSQGIELNAEENASTTESDLESEELTGPELSPEPEPEPALEPEPETETPIEPEPDFPNVAAVALSMRNFFKKVEVTESATHSCEIKDFRIDISDRESTTGTITFSETSGVRPHRISKGFDYSVEIGGLPNGVDMQFIDGGYFKEFDLSDLHDQSIDFEIKNQKGSRKGDFSVPVIFTKKGKSESFTICQLNIVNM